MLWWSQPLCRQRCRLAAERRHRRRRRRCVLSTVVQIPAPAALSCWLAASSYTASALSAPSSPFPEPLLASPCRLPCSVWQRQQRRPALVGRLATRPGAASRLWRRAAGALRCAQHSTAQHSTACMSRACGFAPPFCCLSCSMARSLAAGRQHTCLLLFPPCRCCAATARPPRRWRAAPCSLCCTTILFRGRWALAPGAAATVGTCLPCCSCWCCCSCSSVAAAAAGRQLLLLLLLQLLFC